MLHSITYAGLLSMALRTVCAMATGHPVNPKLSTYYTTYLGHLCCLLSSSPGPSWNPLPDSLCWAAAAAAGSPPARTARSPPWGPLLQPGPGRRWSLAVWSPSSSRLIAVPMRHSKNVTPGREVQAFDWGDTQRGREGGRHLAGLRVQLRQITQRKMKLPEIGRCGFQNKRTFVACKTSQKSLFCSNRHSSEPFGFVCFIIKCLGFNCNFRVNNGHFYPKYWSNKLKFDLHFTSWSMLLYTSLLYTYISDYFPHSKRGEFIKYHVLL